MSPKKGERHLNVPLPDATHEALHIWSSRTREPARRLVLELIEDRLQDLGILPRKG